MITVRVITVRNARLAAGEIVDLARGLEHDVVRVPGSAGAVMKGVYAAGLDSPDLFMTVHC